MLTKRVLLDAADAERCVSSCHLHISIFESTQPFKRTLMLTLISPLKPAELQVLRSQFEKEGEHVGVQTKFNFAWVGAASRVYI
jgi:hypothetical protein